MQLRRLGHAIRQAAAARDLARDAGRQDEGAAVRVGVERGQRRADREERRLDVDRETRVPVVDRGRVEVGECGEARVALEGLVEGTCEMGARTALAMMMSRPPSFSMVSCTVRLQSSSTPASYCSLSEPRLGIEG